MKMKKIGNIAILFSGSGYSFGGYGVGKANAEKIIKIDEEKILSKGETHMNKFTREHYLDSVKEMQIGAIGKVTELDNNYKPPTMRSNIKKGKRR